MNNNRYFLKLTLFILSVLTFSLVGNAEAVLLTSNNQTSNNPVPNKPALNNSSSLLNDTKKHFSQLVKSIDSQLIKNQQQLKADDQILLQFVKQNILSNWHVELTLKRLLSKEKWGRLSSSEINALKQRFNETLHRYMQEAMGYYDNQRIIFVSIKLNKRQTKGLLTLQLQPIYLPSFNVSFKINYSNNQWLLYDAYVEGISYIKMKRGDYREHLDSNGIKGLLAYLDKKNGK